MRNLLRDMAAMFRNPRQWWFNATHSQCPKCGEMVDVARWYQHKMEHQ